MLCNILPQVQNVSPGLSFDAFFGTEHDLRFLKLHVIPSYRSVEHDFLNLDMVQSGSRLF